MKVQILWMGLKFFVCKCMLVSTNYALKTFATKKDLNVAFILPKLAFKMSKVAFQKPKVAFKGKKLLLKMPKMLINFYKMDPWFRGLNPVAFYCLPKQPKALQQL